MRSIAASTRSSSISTTDSAKYSATWIYRRLEALELEYQAIVQSLRRIEGLLADEMGRREVLERSVQELKQNVAFLQARIEELERRIRS